MFCFRHGETKLIKFTIPAGFMTKCLSLDGLSQWEVVLMEEDTTITLTP